MRWGFSFLLLLFLLLSGPRAAFSVLQYRYDCGNHSMQLLAYPTHSHTVRFKVMDEFGTRFDVANCSICLHWLNTGADGAVIFSSGYEGCHVLVKDDHYILRVQLEEMLLSGVLVASYEVNMTCPQPEDYEILTDSNWASRGNSVHQTQADVLVPLSQPGLLHHISQSTFTLSGPQLPPQAHLEPVHPMARTQPVLVHPGLQLQPGQARPISQSQQGLIRQGLQSQNQPRLVHPGGQNQPGLLHPGVQSQNQPGLLPPRVQSQNQPGLVHPGTQNQPGLLRPGVWNQNQPRLVHPGSQNQPGLLRPGVQNQNQPGLLRPGVQNQNQPGLLRPGVQNQNQPGLLRPGVQNQNQPGLLRPGLQNQNQPGLLRPGVQNQNQPGLLRPGVQNQNQPGLLRPGLQNQNQPGLLRPGVQNQNQPGLLRPGLQNQNQPGLLRPGVQNQNQPGLLRPGLQSQNQPGLLRPGVQNQNQPGLLRPGLQSQNQPGLLRPGVQNQNQPGLLRPGVQSQNQPGLLRPGVQSQNQPGLLRPGVQSQNQPGLLHPGLQSQNQPGLVHPGAQPQPGLLRPGFVSQNQPGLVSHNAQSGLMHAGAQTQGGFVPSGAQPQIQPGLAHPNLQTHSQAGLLRPGLQSQAGLVHPSHSRQALAHPGLQSRPGLVRPGLQAQPQPGLVRPGLQPQAQPGLLRPGLQSQPSLLQSTTLFYPSAGAGIQLTREQCQVAVGRIPCVAPQGQEACLQAGCCYDDMDRVAPCYYGNTATVQCLLDGHFVVVVPRGIVTQPYNLDSVRLASSQAGCEPLRVTETFVMFHFPVTQCGTTVQVIEDRLIYENQLISTIDVQGSPRGSVTRDSIYILQARCIYNASDLLPLRMEVAVPPTATPLAMPGPLEIQLRIATDENYSSYHPEGDYPLVRVLRDPIYVEVRLLQKTDPNLVLVLHHCWASPSTEAATEPQWPILVDGCPFTGDNYRTQLVPVGPASPQLPFPSHYQRFVISTFAFVEPPSMAVLEGEVYISCSASVCHLAQPEPCRPSCQLEVPSRARRSPRDRTGETSGTVTSQGHIIFPKVPKLRRG